MMFFRRRTNIINKWICDAYLKELLAETRNMMHTNEKYI